MRATGSSFDVGLISKNHPADFWHAHNAWDARILTEMQSGRNSRLSPALHVLMRLEQSVVDDLFLTRLRLNSSIRTRRNQTIAIAWRKLIENDSATGINGGHAMIGHNHDIGVDLGRSITAQSLGQHALRLGLLTQNLGHSYAPNDRLHQSTR